MVSLEENPKAVLAEKYINQTRENIFLTGKAGTGKTTFLRRLNTFTNKTYIITAPTGIAAMNAGGITLHSLFNLPNAMFIPESLPHLNNTNIITHKQILGNLNYTQKKLLLIKKLDLLIIDEVSMLRSDILDMIDLILRRIRNCTESPFGGLQILFIGDLFQLPPVLTGNEQSIFQNFYNSHYFFDAKAIKESKLIHIELTRVYRQKDQQFVNLLNKIRHNQIEEGDLKILNQKIFDPLNNKGQNMVTLTTHLHKANEINTRQLLKIDGELFIFQSQTKGKFDNKSFPGETELKLKVGAQVMVLKNDSQEKKRYFNGKIGKVHQIVSEGIYIVFNNETEPVLVQKECWKNIAYEYDKDKPKIDVIGELEQFPIRLAWAITIHKSQGLSFDEAVIDTANSFSEGQVYVALSRLTNFEGLYLTSQISTETLSQNKAVIEFTSLYNNHVKAQDCLSEDTIKYIRHLLIQQFSWVRVIEHLEFLIRQIDVWRIDEKFERLKHIENLYAEIKKIDKVAKTFASKLQEYFLNERVESEFIIERINSASIYFEKIIKESLNPIAKLFLLNQNRLKFQKEYIDACKEIERLLQAKLDELNCAKKLVDGLVDNKDHAKTISQYFKAKIDTQAVDIDNSAALVLKKTDQNASQKKTLDLFKTGLTIVDIATKRRISSHVVEKHIAECIKAGDIKIEEIVPLEKLNFLLPLIPDENADINNLKIEVGVKYSFFELKSVINHVIYIKKYPKDN